MQDLLVELKYVNGPISLAKFGVEGSAPKARVRQQCCRAFPMEDQERSIIFLSDPPRKMTALYVSICAGICGSGRIPSRRGRKDEIVLAVLSCGEPFLILHFY